MKIEKINLIWTSLSICTYYISRHGRVRHRLWKPKILKTEYVRFHSKTFENVDFTLKKWYFGMKNVSFKIKIWIKNCENWLKLRKFEWDLRKFSKKGLFSIENPSLGSIKHSPIKEICRTWIQDAINDHFDKIFSCEIWKNLQNFNFESHRPNTCWSKSMWEFFFTKINIYRHWYIGALIFLEFKIIQDYRIFY